MSLDSKRDFWPDPPEKPSVDNLELLRMSMDHIEEILKLENENFPTPWSREAFEYDLTKNDLAYYWIVVKDGEIIGYAGIWLVGDIAHITTICVSEKFRGRGIGKWLLLKVMKIGEELGAERYTLEVRETNTVAIGMYRDVGFREVGRRENYYQEIGEDALVMWTGEPPFEA